MCDSAPKINTLPVKRCAIWTCTVWSIWLATLQTCITRPAYMLESCAIAHLKELFIAFILFLIPILTYSANSIISTFKMKSPMPQIWQENSPFKKSKKIWTVKRSTLRFPTKIQLDFIKEFFWLQGKWFEASHWNTFYCIIKHFKEMGCDQKMPSQGEPIHVRQSL